MTTSSRPPGADTARDERAQAERAQDTIVLHELSHSFGTVHALRDVSLRVRSGELFGVIGPDGAGKTTLFRIVTSLVVPTQGSAQVLGLDPVRDFRALRRRLGYMPGRFALYTDLSVIENLTFYATVFGTTIAQGMRIIEPIWRQLAPFAERRAGALSGGMKQKLALCCALVHAPDLLVLDEPTTGVDAVSRVEFWELLGRLRDGGLTILVSTPYMDEAGRCDRVALMQEGRVLAIETPAAMAASYPLPLFAVRGHDRLGILAALRASPHAASVWPFGEVLHYTDTRRDVPPSELVRDIEAVLAAAGVREVQVVPIAATVEDVFMRMAQDIVPVPERAA
jgi:ABC-type multidrug transport system ATPase subunit